MKRTYTVIGYLKHLAASYVKSARDRLTYAQLYLCGQYSMDEEDAQESFPMRTFMALAEQRGIKTFALVDGFCQKYTHNKAASQLVLLLRKQGYAVYSARKRDKERTMRGKYLNPDSLTTLTKETTLCII